MKRTYQVVTKPSTLSSRELAEFLSKDGQLLLPLVELLERGEKAIDEVIDVMGRATVEAVLRMSAEQLAGPKRQGRRADDRALYWHGSQPGRVTLSERQLRVEKPRLRKKTARQGERGEVAIPAYDAMQRDQRLADRMLAIMLNGVSTRRYETVLPAMAEQVGISKSEVSRETIEAGTRVLQDLAERDFSKVDVLIIYLDGIQFGNHHVLAAVGVDEDGKKYVLGVRSGASENATVTTALLEDLVARGIRPDRRRLFVVDGAKALRSAIAQVFGAGNEVQRCRNHKLRNVVGHLPNAQHDQARATLRAAWKLEAKEGMRKLDQYASWLQRDWPDAAASVREGLDGDLHRESARPARITAHVPRAQATRTGRSAIVAHAATRRADAADHGTRRARPRLRGSMPRGCAPRVDIGGFPWYTRPETGLEHAAAAGRRALRGWWTEPGVPGPALRCGHQWVSRRAAPKGCPCGLGVSDRAVRSAGRARDRRPSRSGSSCNSAVPAP